MKRPQIRVVSAIIIILSVLFSCGPYLWLVLQAFRDRLAITASPPQSIGSWSLSNFAWSYNGQDLFSLMGNAIVISAGSAILTVIIGAPAAYYFARYRSRLSKSLYLFVLSTRMGSPIAISLPLLVVFSGVGLRGTFAGVILAQTVFSIAFAVWFLESAFSQSPPELEWAAQVDGRTKLQAVAYVLFPATAPTIAATFAFVFLFSWNEFMISSLLSNSLTRPVTAALPGFIAQATSQWGAFCAVALLASLPPLLIAFAVRHFLSAAMTFGAVGEQRRSA